MRLLYAASFSLTLASSLELNSAIESAINYEEKNHFSLLGPNLWDYGCYCSQVFGQDGQDIKINGQPADWTDELCFQLLQCLKCPKIKMSQEEKGECNLLDSDTKYPFLLGFDSSDKKFFEKACSVNKSPCRNNQCQCYSKFMVGLLSKPLLSTANIQRKTALKPAGTVFECNGEGPELQFCEDPIEDEYPKEDDCSDYLTPNGTKEDISILNPQTKCWNIAELGNNQLVGLSDSKISNKLQKEDYINDIFNIEPEKVCQSNMQIFFNHEDNSIAAMRTEKSKKCLHSHTTKFWTKWGACKGQTEYELRPVQVAGSSSGKTFEIYVAGQDNLCLAANNYKNSKKFNTLMLKKGKGCMVFDVERIKPAIEGISKDQGWVDFRKGGSTIIRIFSLLPNNIIPLPSLATLGSKQCTKLDKSFVMIHHGVIIAIVHCFAERSEAR